MNIRYLVLTFLLPFSAIFTPDASAHSGDVWPYVTISCNQVTGSVKISEDISENEAGIPKGNNIQSLDKMLRLKSIGNDGILSISFTFVRTCKVRRILYRVEIVPYLFNNRIQGMCGTAAPSAKLTIYRNKIMLLSDFIFRTNCLADGDAAMKVESIELSETEKKAEIEIKKSTIAERRIVDYAELPTLIRSALFK